ncbi:MAG TPA: hypothetical protein VK689_18260, partial [Armatimonadota bacterium]|nr:hypothetical protein [Armatimonadota bacterium]
AGEDTQPQNNTSLVLLLEVEGRKYLLTADAGQQALWNAIQAAAELGVFLNDLAFLQVPHHGSRRNLSPQLLDWISARIAYISTASEHTPKHPSQAVINEFLRRRTRVLCNQGRTLRYHRQAPDRGWKGAASEEFQSRFLA